MTATTNSPNVANTQANTINYAIGQSLLQINTVLPCQIIEVNGDGTFDVQSLINYLDATAAPITPPEIYNIPAMVIQGGNAGVIIQYQVGDKILVNFVQRDISIIKKSWTRQNPASYRRFNLGDGIIIGYLSNTPPSIYVKIENSGITITAPSLPVIVNANEVDINAGTIKLGQSGLQPVLIENVAMNFSSPNLQGGSGASGTMTFTSGGSSIVSASV